MQLCFCKIAVFWRQNQNQNFGQVCEVLWGGAWAPPEVHLCYFCLPGVISMVIFCVLCVMVFVIRHMFRHKGSYHTNEAKGAESADCADAAIIVNDPAFTETIDESKKEWFIWGVGVDAPGLSHVQTWAFIFVETETGEFPPDWLWFLPSLHVFTPAKYVQ